MQIEREPTAKDRGGLNITTITFKTYLCTLERIKELFISQFIEPLILKFNAKITIHYDSLNRLCPAMSLVDGDIQNSTQLWAKCHVSNHKMLTWYLVWSVVEFWMLLSNSDMVGNGRSKTMFWIQCSWEELDFYSSISFSCLSRQLAYT